MSHFNITQKLKVLLLLMFYKLQERDIGDGRGRGLGGMSLR